MGDASPAVTPSATKVEQKQRSRSRSIISSPTAAIAVPVSAIQYSPESHPTTDPSLLALSQRQLSDVPIDSSLLEQTTAANAFPIDPALGGDAAAPSAEAPQPVDGTASSSPTGEMTMQDAPGAVREDTADPDAIIEDDSAGPSSRNSKRGSVAEDSDAELRRLAAENANVELSELARRVRNDENSPSAEKTRQVYGLGWLMHNCERVADTSVAVPRNRVYARYVTVCANEKIKPLNPASFGKLVRLLYPEIKTRRLGVRGQSKYHYCGIRLAGEHASPNANLGSASGSEPPAHAAGDDHVTSTNSSTAPVGIFGPSNKAPSKPYETPLSNFMLHELCFSTDDGPSTVNAPHDVFRIPDITPYLPSGTDLDVSATLMAIYRSHCTSLIECVRFMRLKQFHQLFISFHGGLTVPVQKLLATPTLAPWIREADWSMYQEMIRLLSPLAAQAVPPPVIEALRQLSREIPTHIANNFRSFPDYIIQSKVAPAEIFVSLIDRLLRVNDAAHAAARFLGSPPDRDQMVKDWEAFVQTDMIINREIPCHAPQVKSILSQEIPALLQHVPAKLTNGSITGHIINNLASGVGEPTPVEIPAGPSTESVLDRWTNFLNRLPERFDGITPRYFNICLGAVASAALRDLTTNGAISFGSWWVVRCWIDEWMAWQAEKGGFLKHVTEGGIQLPTVIKGKVVQGFNRLGSQGLPGNVFTSDDMMDIAMDNAPLEVVGDDRDNRIVDTQFGK
ncbi:RFX DNA-binding domain-containing protein [Pyronema domesticum]|nr:RFX DNA-binding domain-containing protein [Pyronema domesticum]